MIDRSDAPAMAATEAAAQERRTLEYVQGGSDPRAQGIIQLLRWGCEFAY